MTSAAGIALVVALFAQGGDGAAAGDADVLIRQGLELRDKRDDEGALRLFRRAFEIAGTGRAQAQVALAEQALGRWPEAEADLTAALGHADEPWIAAKKPLLDQALAEIQGHLGSLELTGLVAGAELWIDGARAGARDLTRPLRLPAGRTAIELRAAGHQPIVRTVEIPARGTAREQLVFAPAIAPPGPDEPRATPSGPPGVGARTIAGFAITGAGVLALAGGIAFHLVRESRANAFNDAGCGETDGAVSGGTACQGRFDGVQSARNLAIAGYIAGAVLGGVGAVLLLTGHRDGPAVASAGASGGWTCAPGADSGGGGIVCSGRF